MGGLNFEEEKENGDDMEHVSSQAEDVHGGRGAQGARQRSALRSGWQVGGKKRMR